MFNISLYFATVLLATSIPSLFKIPANLSSLKGFPVISDEIKFLIVSLTADAACNSEFSEP